MPLRNRVRPDGTIVADDTRGLFMGNRGRLIDASGAIRRQWQSKRWICCVTEFRDRRVLVMASRKYTPLFFLDEATALAAGHRPCAECRWRDFNLYADAWRQANGPATGRIYVDMIDSVLHAQRTAAPILADFKDLADGAIVADGAGDSWLYWQGGLKRWTPHGYERSVEIPKDTLRLLTPLATLTTLREGYRPVIHHSAKVDP